MSRIRILSLVLIFIVFNLVDAGGTPRSDQETFQGFLPAQRYTVEILNIYPHDPSAFTQGLLIHDGTFYESTGQHGESTLRQVEIETGNIIRSIDVLRPPVDRLKFRLRDYFAEGLELIGDELIQLTWTSGVAFTYDRETFEQTGQFTYGGQGWGICSDGDYLYMSDSTEYISIREIDTFDLIGRMLVTIEGSPVQSNRLNELECVDDIIYANFWQTDFIVQINKFNGNVVGVIDASGLLTQDIIREIPGHFVDQETGEARPPFDADLNGIAYNPITDTFFITGKYWSRMFEVVFIPAPVPDQ